MNEILNIDNCFWNIRSSFKIFGVIDIGTHASLVKLNSGKYVLLDTIQIPDNSEIETWLMDSTNDGMDLEAIINVHPFHTVHVAALHKKFPNARLYGTKRHLEKLPDLAWQTPVTESPDFHKLYQNDFTFHIPQGVLLVTDDPHVHFSSVIVYHLKTRTIHVDDTFGYAKDVPLLARFVINEDSVSLHPMLAKALEKRAGAGKKFSDWLKGFINDHPDIQNLCTAHNASLLAKDNQGKSIPDRLSALLSTKIVRLLENHDKRF